MDKSVKYSKLNTIQNVLNDFFSWFFLFYKTLFFVNATFYETVYALRAERENYWLNDITYYYYYYYQTSVVSDIFSRR